MARSSCFKRAIVVSFIFLIAFGSIFALGSDCTGKCNFRVTKRFVNLLNCFSKLFNITRALTFFTTWNLSCNWHEFRWLLHSLIRNLFVNWTSISNKTDEEETFLRCRKDEVEQTATLGPFAVASFRDTAKSYKCFLAQLTWHIELNSKLT